MLIEYAIGNIAVAISWSDYFTGLLAGYGIRIPPHLTMDFLTASRSYAQVTELLARGSTLEQIQLMSDLIVYLCFRRRLSLIPVLGLMSCGYLMTELGITNWIRFLLWLTVGLAVYFLYGYRHSKLARQSTLA